MAVGPLLRRCGGRPRTDGLDEAILDATLRVLARDGYERMSLESVAREAGTTRTSIYRRHPSKAALVTAAITYRSESCDSPEQDTGDTRDDLIAELRAFHRSLRRTFGLSIVGTVLAEEYHNPELLRLYREDSVRPGRKRLEAILQRAKERGEIPPDTDIDLLTSMMHGGYYAAYLAGMNPDDDWAERVVDLVLATVRVPVGDAPQPGRDGRA